MPPVPPKFDQETTDLIGFIERRRKDIDTFQLSRLEKCTGPLSTQQQYASELRDDIEILAKQIDELDVLVDDQQGQRNKRYLREITQGFYDDLKGWVTRIKSELRNALLVSKRNIDSQNASNREELFRSSTVSDEKAVSGEKTAGDALTKANNDVTEALRRTINLMQGELERSVLSTQMLDASTATLRSTSSTYDTLDDILMASKQLVTALEKADRMDKLLIMAGLVFFFLVVLFILKQRVIDRGIRIALFWTRFIPRKAKTVEDILERGDLKVTSTATSIATSITTLAASVLR
ncbi:Sec20-domain-containing protein [Thelephora ganbajun]|uniref:Sec20-domain-containing protein n=1 Tax=Thelephora ganbajun TaxID=370292 RepID=A0ACB6ZUN2_THEGA|nr:Sec20-domain-containing protein [Thelephora ganbajun]